MYFIAISSIILYYIDSLNRSIISSHSHCRLTDIAKSEDQRKHFYQLRQFGCRRGTCAEDQVYNIYILLQHYNNADIPSVHVYNSHTYSLVRLFKPEKAKLGILLMWLPLRSLKIKSGWGCSKRASGANKNTSSPKLSNFIAIRYILSNHYDYTQHMHGHLQ